KIGSYILTGTQFEAVDISSLKITLSNTSGYTNLILKNGDIPIANIIPSPSATGDVINFDTPLNIRKFNKKILDVYIDIGNNTSGTISSTMGNIVGTGVDTGSTITSPADAIGQTMTIVYSTITLSKNSSFVNTTATPGTLNIKVGSFILEAGNAEAVNVNSIKTNFSQNSAYQNIKLTNNDVAVSNTITTPDVNGDVVFNTSTLLTIPASQSKIIDVYADITSGVTGTVIATMGTILATGTASGGSIPSPADVVGQTITITPATHTISGTIKYYDGIKVITNATVILENNTGIQIATTTTDASGFYEFTEVVNGGNYVIKVNKTDNNILGLTGADQGKIGRHIIRLELLDSIYKIISGDVNNSGGLSGADQGKIGRRIIGLDSNLPSGAWKFYSSDVTPTTTNYLTAGLTRTYSNLTINMLNQNFVGLKMGDVNNSWINN
ncbi:MAG: carboxypeptidase regulatory-like domain-containing protein, partial [Patescibacteria group bacterium]